MSERRYFARRAMQEMRRAQRADDPAVVEVHKVLQRAYAERASTGERERVRPEEIG